MHAIKRQYISMMHNLAVQPALARLGDDKGGDSYSWRRWLASLFAIYDTERMVELDVPWWNVAATRAVENFLANKPGARIFEYGSGASTVWLARRAGEVITVEHDRDWFDGFMRQTQAHDNVNLLYRPIDDGPDGYVYAIDELDGDFDLIVVDGRHRASCLDHASTRLARGGAVLFDDSGRSRYRNAIETCALREQHFLGLSFCVPYPDHTSILRHD